MGALLSLGGLAAFLLWRRLSEAMAVAPQAGQLAVAVLLLLLLSNVARCAWSLARRGRIELGAHGPFNVAVAVATAVAGLSLSFLDTPFAARVAFWAAIVADQAFWLWPWTHGPAPDLAVGMADPLPATSPVAAADPVVAPGPPRNDATEPQTDDEPLDTCEIETDPQREAALLARLGAAKAPEQEPASRDTPEDASWANDPEDEAVVQQVTRAVTDGWDTISGTLVVRLAPGQSVERAHVAFCPPMAVVPEVEVAQTAGVDCAVRAAQVLTCGLRVEARVRTPPSRAETIRVAFRATAPCDDAPNA